MQKIWNKYINLGVKEQTGIHEITKIRMINFGTIFVMLAGVAFYFQSLDAGSKILSIALISSPVFFLLVPVFQSYGATKIAGNILFFGLCVDISIYSLVDNPSSFTLNYFFGIAMLSFIIYSNNINRFLGLLLCVLLYFGLSYIRPFVQTTLAFDPILYVMDVCTLFLAILLCLNYFQKINKNQFDIILNQKLELEKININKDKLISLLSHDIRSPLNNLNQILNLQNSESLNNEELNFILTKVRKEFIHQSESIENLLKWSQNQLTEILANFEHVEISILIENIIKELNFNINSKNLNIQIELADKNIVTIDKMHLHIIIRNILNNAIKFSQKNGTIKIQTQSNASEFIIDIIDFGIGFEGVPSSSFIQFEHTEQQFGTQKEYGNGLGLLICKELIEKNNGIILIKNNANLGSTVRIQINT